MQIIRFDLTLRRGLCDRPELLERRIQSGQEAAICVFDCGWHTDDTDCEKVKSRRFCVAQSRVRMGRIGVGVLLNLPRCLSSCVPRRSLKDSYMCAYVSVYRVNGWVADREDKELGLIWRRVCHVIHC